MTFPSIRLATVTIALLAAPLVGATSAHTWVSGTGNDLNVGSRTAPYATFQTAMTNTTAGGMISVADSGDFGAVSITKAVTIDGGTIGGTITFSGSIGININAATTDTVILRNLTVNGLGLGQDAIFLTSALNLIIENCNLENFVSIGLGIGSGSAQNIVVTNTRITGGQLGLRVFQGVGPDQISVRHSTISGQTSAAVFIRSGLTEISDSVITQSSIGLEDDTSAVINVVNSVISYNTTDALAFLPSVILISSNNTLFANNGTGGTITMMSAGGGQIVSGSRNGTLTSVPNDTPRQARH